MGSILFMPENCVNIDGSIFKFCLPVRETCFKNPKGGILADCDKLWNCNLCQTDSKYFIPYLQGDKIQIQTLFYDGYNTNRKNPQAGWGQYIKATLCLPDMELIDMNLFSSRSMVAYGCSRSYQIIEIDTSLFDKDCWSLKFESFDSSNNKLDEICTQQFGRVDDCVETYTLQGKKTSGVDCYGFCYGEPQAYFGDYIEYDNTLRFHGYYKAMGGDVTFTEVGNKLSTSTIRDLYSLRMGRKVPPFIEQIIRKQLLGAKTICVDGIDYEVDSFSISNELDKGRMFLFDVDIYAECELSSGCIS